MIDAPPTSLRPRISTLVSILIAIVAAILRFYRLGTKSIWLDEGMSIAIARLPWNQFFKLIWAREANMTAYYVVLHFWLKLGSSEYFIRSLSAILGVATVTVVEMLGRELFDRTTGWIAAALLALNAWHIAASQEARGYSLAMLALALSAYFLARLLRTRDAEDRTVRRNSVLFALASVLAIYCHLYAALVVASEWIAAAFAWPSDADRRRQFFRAFRLSVYFVSPLILFLAMRGTSQIGWIAQISRGLFRQFIYDLTGGGGIALQALYALGFVLSAVVAIRAARAAKTTRALWPYLLVWAWAVIPPVIVLLLSKFWKPVFFPRYLIVILPAFVLIAASGVARLRPNWAMALLTFALLAFSVDAIRKNRDAYFEFGRDDWRSATKFVVSYSGLDDAAIFLTAPGRAPFEYYRRQVRAERPQVISPAHGANPREIDFRDLQPEPLAETFQTLPESSPRIWLILSPYSPDNPLDRGTMFMRHWCETRYRLAQENRFSGIDVLLYTKP
ncbi:MAG TPA: glycosyltransferase family 39 protein [Candidatus Acidoferrales bacterium]|nr:glycosyltransferase family 39 protein [Candidatus Acidoferrales bacterium]